MAVKKLGNKKPAAKKKTTKPGKKTTSTKITGTKNSKSTNKKSVRKVEKKNVDRAPVYALVIMILLSVIVLLLNKIDNENRIINNDEKKISKIKGEINKKQKEKANDKPQNIPADKEITKKVTRKVIINKSEEYNQKSNLSNAFIYLVKFNRESEKMSLTPIKRRVEANTHLKLILKELIKGPNSEEKRKGFLTAIPDKLKIRNVQVINRNAVLDFNTALEYNANGDILLTRIDQVVYTATQFDEIDGVIIKINGKRKEFLGGEGLFISCPIKRRRD